MPYIVRYKSADPKRTLLGGVSGFAETSRFESKQDAELHMQGILDVHAKLDTPLTVIAEVKEVTGPIDIFDDGSCKGCTWGKAAAKR